MIRVIQKKKISVSIFLLFVCLCGNAIAGALPGQPNLLLPSPLMSVKSEMLSSKQYSKISTSLNLFEKNSLATSNSTQEKFRRAEIIFFIGVPFAFVYSWAITTKATESAGNIAYNLHEWERQFHTYQKQNSHLSASEKKPFRLTTFKFMADYPNQKFEEEFLSKQGPNAVTMFIWANAFVWAFNIAFNDYYENSSSKGALTFETEMDELRVSLNILREKF